MKRARIIYNPTSGREAIRRDLVDILNVYEQEDDEIPFDISDIIADRKARMNK